MSTHRGKRYIWGALCSTVRLLSPVRLLGTLDLVCTCVLLLSNLICTFKSLLTFLSRSKQKRMRVMCFFFSQEGLGDRMSCHMYNLKVSEWFLTASYAHIFWNILELFDYLEQLQTSLAPLHPLKCAGPPA